ncbi:VOC family protein [Kytococcus sedentarius]|uniref:VOC family protein n=1 Tax=Kytococcus sedentarius TaxID=1276 RepID=UPI00384B74AA
MTARTSPQRPGTPVWRDFWTTDPQGTARFLTEVLGCTIRENGPEPGYSVAELPQGAVCGIGPATAEETPTDIAALFLASDDVDATHARALELGATEAIAPTDAGPNGRFSTVVDPTGALVSFWQAGEQTGYAAVDEVGFPCWQTLYSTDADAARRFYGELFGIEFGDDMPGYPIGGFGEDALFGIGPEASSSHWMQYVMVEDLEATLATAVALGATETHRDSAPFGAWIDLRTPGGAAFGIFQATNEWGES